MLLRTRWQLASKHARHTWMMLMVDECAVMAVQDIPFLVNRTLWGEKTQNMGPAMSIGSALSSSMACSESAVVDEGREVTTPTVGTTEEKLRAWAAVARLLSESGDWVRATAVVESLPLAQRQSTKSKAIHSGWPLPHAVKAAWKGSLSPPSSFDKEVMTVFGAPSTSTPTATNAQASRNSAHEESCPSYTSSSSDDLVRLAYGLRKGSVADAALLHEQAVPISSRALKQQQQAIIAELHRRGATLEAIQCILNWQRRRLTLPDVEVSRVSSAGQREELFDGVGAVKRLLFLCDAERGTERSMVTSPAPSVPASSRLRVKTLNYSLSQLHTIRQAVANHAVLVARCARDRTVVDQLLRHGGEAFVEEIVEQLLLKVVQMSRETERWPAACASVVLGHRSDAKASPPPCTAASVETCWRAIAALLLPLNLHLRAQSKARKQSLLTLLIAAVEATVACTALQQRRRDYVAGNCPGSGGEEQCSHAGGSLKDVPGSTNSIAPPVEISEKVRHAIRATVESACSPLLHHEPQVRFLRLHTFARLAAAIAAIAVPTPNALAQCLFLCMADTGPLPLPLPPTPHVRGDASAYVESAPSCRWWHALAMVETARRLGVYRVSAAHARSILSGLQSISIPRTWMSALRTVEVFENAYHVTPDVRTLPTLLLNYRQRSWQDAFHVLRYVRHDGRDDANIPLWRDLQLVGLKYASWEVPLRLMTPLRKKRADGFMNYLYCLCAAARGGKAALAFEYFTSLREGQGRHAALQTLSPYNELTVAVAAVAMLDYRQEVALVDFCQKVLSMRTDEPVLVMANSAATCALPDHSLTLDGQYMAQAAYVSALLSLQRYAALTSFLLEWPPETLPFVLPRVTLLHCLTGLGDLHAPVRLVFDILGYRGGCLQLEEANAQAERPTAAHVQFLSAVESAQGGESGTFETRQGNPNGSRRHLFIPIPHQRKQRKAVASAWGAFTRDQESALPAYLARTIAESMVGEGVGAEYMAATLL